MKQTAFPSKSPHAEYGGGHLDRKIRRKNEFFIIHLGRGGAVAEVGGEGAGLRGTGTMWPEESRILLL